MSKFFCGIFILLALMISGPSVFAAEFVPGEVIVKLRAKPESIEATAFVGRAVTAHRMHLKNSFDKLNMHHFRLLSGSRSKNDFYTQNSRVTT